MQISQLLNEISTPTGAIFIRFKEKVGAVSANPQRGERSEATYLTAYAGFANAPEDLQQGNALRNFNSINSAEDIVSMIKAIFTDKVFLSVKSLTIYDDFTKPLQGDNSPIYKRHPFLLKFMKWVEREGGDQIKIADKVGKEGPPKIKRPRKENPNFGRKIRDVEQGETKKTVTFTVGPRFYKQAQRDLPNLMRFRGPNGTFVMPNDLFMQFRAQAEKTYPYAEIKLINRVATGESLNEGSDKGPHDCGAVDGYYGRAPNPHKYEMGKRVKLTDPREIAAYMAGYKDDSTGSKVYEDSVTEIGDTKRGQKLINKVHKRASDRLGKAVADKDPKNARKYQEVGQQAWDRMPSNKYDEEVNFSETELAHFEAVIARKDQKGKEKGIGDTVDSADLTDEYINEMAQRGVKAGTKRGSYKGKAHKGGADATSSSMPAEEPKGVPHVLDQIRHGQEDEHGFKSITHPASSPDAPVTKRIHRSELHGFYDRYHNTEKPAGKEKEYSSFLGKHFGDERTSSPTTKSVTTDLSKVEKANLKGGGAKPTLGGSKLVGGSK